MRNHQLLSRTLLTISSPSSSSAHHLESDICITIAVLFGIMMVLTLFYSFITRCFNNTNNDGDSDHRTTELRPCSELDKAIPVITFDSSSSTPFDSDNCAICLAEFGNGDRIRVLPCKHVFHAECIDQWLPSRSSRCPVCRVKVVKCGDKLAVTNCSNAMQVINFSPTQFHNYL